jgi:hypothetical protein
MTKSDDESIRARIKAIVRAWNGFWTFGDKPVAEQGLARKILEQSGVHVVDLVSRGPGQDPPDCEAKLDGRFSGVEVTELVDPPTLKRSLKAIKLRKAGKKPTRPEAYFNWDRDALRSALQARIDAKDQPSSKQKGGPYERYVLVIHTDEFFLDRDTVSRFLEGASFRATFITDVFLGLSYHPSVEPKGGCYPVFRLSIRPRMSRLVS